jgi:ubiquinone biosynthesis protein UbiJ
VLAALFENMLNRNLAGSPRARELCAALRGSRLRIGVRGSPWAIRVESLGTTLAIAGEAAAADGTPSVAGPPPPGPVREARICGSIVDLVALAGPDPEALVQRGAVRIDGDAELAQQYRELGLLLRPDLEEELSRWVGDAAAHRAGTLARQLAGFARRAATTAVRNSAEYLAHERGDLVPRAEADAFFEGVDRLREDTDRLEARLAALEAAP